MLILGLSANSLSAQEAADKEDTIDKRQQRVATRYSELETKLLALVEYEKENNPARAKLLKRAFVLSQEQGTSDLLGNIVDLINENELKDAEDGQDEAVGQLKRLLKLLQSEDRSKRIKDELKRNQEYLKEVERLLRIQKSIRGQAEGGVDGPRLAKSQKKTADQTRGLADKIEDNEEEAKEDGDEDGEDGSSSESDGDAEGKGKKPIHGKGGKGKGGKGGEGQPGQGGQPGEGQSGEGSDQQGHPALQKIRRAAQKMRDAKRRLDEAKRDQSIERMLEAERELAQAKRELEEILRQLREEEVERTLAALEGRFRKMLERELKVREQTQKLGAIPSAQRKADFEINAGKLATEQTSISTDASRALLLLREDGTSVAFPQTVEDMIEDMQQVASRLSLAKVGNVTVEIENDIVETLNYLIEALAKAQKDMESQKRNRSKKPGKGGMPGEGSLINQLAEIRMLRALQNRIHRRHIRYSKMLENPDDLLGETSDPEIRMALRRLTARQKQLTEITKEIVAGMGE